MAQTLERHRNGLDFAIMRKSRTLLFCIAEFEKERSLLGNQGNAEPRVVRVSHSWKRWYARQDEVNKGLLRREKKSKQSTRPEEKRGSLYSI
jgi:hypothetical protein